MPAKLVTDSDQGAGIQLELLKLFWIPAFAGMAVYFTETTRHLNEIKMSKSLPFDLISFYFNLSILGCDP